MLERRDGPVVAVLSGLRGERDWQQKRTERQRENFNPHFSRDKMRAHVGLVLAGYCTGCTGWMYRGFQSHSFDIFSFL